MSPLKIPYFVYLTCVSQGFFRRCDMPPAFFPQFTLRQVFSLLSSLSVETWQCALSVVHFLVYNSSVVAVWATRLLPLGGACMHAHYCAHIVQILLAWQVSKVWYFFQTYLNSFVWMQLAVGFTALSYGFAVLFSAFNFGFRQFVLGIGRFRIAHCNALLVSGQFSPAWT